MSLTWKFSRRPGGWVIAERSHASGAIERKRLMLSEVKNKLSANLDGKLWQIQISTGRVAGGADKADLEAALTAQFPGKVRKVLVTAGQQVKEGEKLLLVEAMKMEFAVQAPCDGRIAEIRVKDGQQISPGDRFVRLETLDKNGK